VSYRGGELQPRQTNVPVPYRAQHTSGETPAVVNWAELGTWAKGRGVVIAGVVLVALSLVWKANFLNHYYFWQDDFHFTELALDHSFSWSYLTLVGAGHMFPGLYAVVWAWARAALYNWTAASAISIIMLAAAGLAALRLLRTLFGSRPAILVLLVIYLISPLTMTTIRFWSAAIEALPLQVALFMALNAQVHYVRTGRFRHALSATAWVVAGLLFNEKSAVLPALLIGVTSAFLIEGPWLRSVVQTLRRYWAEWLLQLGLLAAYGVLLKESLHTSSVQPGLPSSAGAAFTFMQDLMKDTFFPGAIGGPWQWFPSASNEYAYSLPPTALIWLSLLAAAIVITVSIVQRRYAWRAWAILAGWLAAADIAPVLLGRITEEGPGVFGLETRYVADAVPVLAICLGLAFLPLAGRADVRRRQLAGLPGAAQTVRLAAAALVGVFVIGSVWSVQALEKDSSGLPARIYMADAQAALAEAPAGTVIYPSYVPSWLMLGIFGTFAQTPQVIGPMETSAEKARIGWSSRPDGTLNHLMVFGPDGRLYPAAIFGQASPPPPPGPRCYPASNGHLVIPFAAKTASWSSMLVLGYLAAPAANGQDVTVRYGAVTQKLTLKTGLNLAYLPVRGSADSVTLSGGPSASSALCVGGMRAGIIVQSPTGAIPAAF
jgi:hypothetical protein